MELSGNDISSGAFKCRQIVPTRNEGDICMFGISPLGWVHTLGSLPAIPVAVYMFARHGRIVPRSTPGAIYFASMLIGAVTVFLVAHESISYGIGAITILFLLAGYGVKRV